ncbi:hypothetical protein A2U01_0104926, partial [Trifolium medium]|nr:hypothetical protein [Trifolium medium]
MIMVSMIESSSWDQITAYAAKNRMQMALGAIDVEESMVVEANGDYQQKMAIEANDPAT